MRERIHMPHCRAEMTHNRLKCLCVNKNVGAGQGELPLSQYSRVSANGNFGVMSKREPINGPVDQSSIKNNSLVSSCIACESRFYVRNRKTHHGDDGAIMRKVIREMR